MRVFSIILLFIFWSKLLAAQNLEIDSFSQLISPRVADSFRQKLSQPGIDPKERVIAFKELSYNVLFSKPDSAMLLAQQGKQLASEIDFAQGEILCDAAIASVWWIIGDYTKANELLLRCLRSSENLNDGLALVWSLAWIISVHRDEGNYQEALKYCRQGMSIPNIWSARVWNTIMASIYQAMHKSDSALLYLSRGDTDDGYTQVLLGHTHADLGNDRQASEHYLKSIPLLFSDNNFKDLAYAYIGLAKLQEKYNKIDSSIYYATKGFEISQNASFKKWVYETGLILSRVYEQKDTKEALRYHKLAMAARDSMFNLQNITHSLNARFTEQLLEQQRETKKLASESRTRTYVLLTALGFVVLLAVILFRNNLHKQKAKEKIEEAYGELKAAQQQLIQSEKMASLGELTAGIAHEIQNPLNFVNNFSEVNQELLQEMQDEINKGNFKEVEAIARVIVENEAKVNHHGKRAEGIVKGMLQHSRKSNGLKESTDINALADEYLRLAYHGLRAKDKSFNVATKTDFDQSIGNIEIIPQDIGRAFLNLITNAFYAVDEKRKQQKGNFQPTVSVSTKKRQDKIFITVTDNGNGIPGKVLDKIFQPFFTTKPTGQGTGLGLSLSYDIVKSHGGEITVDTNENEGTRFTIQLPEK